MEAATAAFCKVQGMELPVSTAKLHPDWTPITASNAKSVRVILPQRFIPVVETFLEYKKKVGSEESKAFFAQFKTIADYVQRLIEKRPAAFFGKSWTTRLRDGTVVEDAREVYKNDGSPISLAEYMTLEEAQIAALLVVSSPAIWAGAAGTKPLHGIAVGITPPKLDEPNLFDALHATVQESGSKSGRGKAAAHIQLGEDSSADAYYIEDKRVDKPSHWQHIWAEAYHGAMKREVLEPRTEEPIRLYFTDEPRSEPTLFDLLADGKTYLNHGIFERRIRFAVEAFFLDCVTRSEATQTPACAILESRVFVKPDDPDRKLKEKYIVNAIIVVLSVGIFERISTLQLINFTASAYEQWYETATLEGPLPMVFAQRIQFISNESTEIEPWSSFFEKNVEDKGRFRAKYFSVEQTVDAGDPIWNVPAEMLPCMAYAWDVNALPGNMLWAGMPSTLPRATIAEVQNPHINKDSTLRALLTPFMSPLYETTMAKLYLIGDHYFDEARDVERGGQPASVARGYGELDRASVDRILSSLDNAIHPGLFKEGAVLYDIGSGQGVFALHAYLSLCERKKTGVAGIEYYETRVDVSNKVKQLVAHHRRDEDGLAGVNFFQGDATTKDLPVGTTIAYSFDLLQGPNIVVTSTGFGSVNGLSLTLDGMYAIKDLSDAYTVTRKQWTSLIEAKLMACSTCTRFVSAMPPRVTVTKTVKKKEGVPVTQKWVYDLYNPDRLKFMRRIENLNLTGGEKVDLYVYEVIH